MEMKIKSCEFNMENGCVEIEYENGGKLYLYTAWIEERLELTPMMRDKLTWLLDKEPITYTEQALDGTLQQYLDSYAQRFDDCEGGIRKSLEKHYSHEIARQIAREMMMYG